MDNSRLPDVSAKGYYYNLEKSPYVWISPYGDSYKLPSRKRVEMIEKQVPEALSRLDKLLEKYELRDSLPPDLVTLLGRYLVNAVYNRIVSR